MYSINDIVRLYKWYKERTIQACGYTSDKVTNTKLVPIEVI